MNAHRSYTNQPKSVRAGVTITQIQTEQQAATRITSQWLFWSGNQARISITQPLQTQGSFRQFGRYTNGNDIIGFLNPSSRNQNLVSIVNEGFVLSTGDVNDITRRPYGTSNEQVIGQCLRQGCTRQNPRLPDVAGFTVSFRAIATGIFTFDYMFASNEMPRYAGQEYNDKFELKVNNENIAFMCPAGAADTSCTLGGQRQCLPGSRRCVDIDSLTPKSGLQGNPLQLDSPSQSTSISSAITNEWHVLFRNNILGVTAGNRRAFQGNPSVGGASNRAYVGDVGRTTQDVASVPRFWPQPNGPFAFSGFTYLLKASKEVTQQTDYALNVSVYDVRRIECPFHRITLGLSIEPAGRGRILRLRDFPRWPGSWLLD